MDLWNRAKDEPTPQFVEVPRPVKLPLVDGWAIRSIGESAHDT